MTFRALDLFCGAGGVSVGLQRAGFEVTGVDIRPVASGGDSGVIQLRCPVCGTLFPPRDPRQVHCRPRCRRRAWRLRNPTLDELAALPAAELRSALASLRERRLALGLDGEDDWIGECQAAVRALASIGEHDLRALLREVMQRRHPGRRGRYRVRYGA